MELTHLRITRTVVTPRYGSMAPGDLLRTDAAFARHLVEDCAAAQYIHHAANHTPAAQDPPQAPARKPRKPKGATS